MKLKSLKDIDVTGKKVLVRGDLDVDDDYSRLEFAEETLDFLIKNLAKTIIIGHKGRPADAKAMAGKPEGQIRQELSLAPLADVLGGVVGEKVVFVSDIIGEEAQGAVKKLADGNVMMLENLRFDPGEEQNNEGFSKSLASLGDFYVNESFAVSHRAHASIVGIPKILPHAAGFRFVKEVANLGRILENPKRPIILVIGGIKKDKMEYIKNFTKVADKILVCGKLPIYFEGKNPDPEKIIMGQLTADTLDITNDTIEKFEEEIAKAQMIILAGVPGKYEERKRRRGTEEVFKAIANSSSFKVAGGGDTEAAITEFGLNDKFDWISVGGGSMLEFLAKGTLPGIEALEV